MSLHWGGSKNDLCDQFFVDTRKHQHQMDNMLHNLEQILSSYPCHKLHDECYSQIIRHIHYSSTLCYIRWRKKMC